MSKIDTNVARAYLEQGRIRLSRSHAKILHCVNQLSEEQMWWRPHESMNSIANVILHLCGNLRQWITSGVGGEEDVRRRSEEFSERGPIPKAELIRRLNEVVAGADAVLASTAPETLLDARRIQGFDETVLSAIFDTLAHFAGHSQEIICITRLQLGDDYQFSWKPETPEQGA